MRRYIVSFTGKEAATAAKASALSLRSLGTCSSFQAERVLSLCLTKEAYFVIRGSLDSNFALTCITTSCESLRIRRLLAPTARASSTSATKASYSKSLLEASKPKLTACSILSPIGEVNCRPIQAPDFLEAPINAEDPLALIVWAYIMLWEFYKEILVLYSVLAQFHSPSCHSSE